MSSNIFFLLSDDFKVCCLAPRSTICFAVKPWYQSCFDLLPRVSVKVAVGSLAWLVFLLSFSSLILPQFSREHELQQKLRQGGNAFRVIVVLVNFCDLLCSLHLGILFAADQIFHGKFAIYSSLWQGNIVCFVTFALSLQFSLMSPFVATFMAFARLMVVLNPIDTKLKRKGFTLKTSVCFTLVILFFSYSFGFILKIRLPKLPSRLCQPYLDPTHSVWMIKLSTLIISSVQIMSMLSIIFLCVKLVSHLQNAKQGIKPVSVSKSQSQVRICFHLMILVSSYLLSWGPANIVHLSSLSSWRCSTELAIWTTIVVPALNSITNPLLFLVSTLRRQRSQMSN